LRNIHEVVRAKEHRLQELDREMQKVQAQLQTLRSAIPLLEEDDSAGLGHSVTDMSELEGRRQPASVADKKPVVAMNAPSSQKQFP
jgi:hypothetical protein